MNSVLETTRAGKPALFIPIFGDQFQNAAMVSRKNSSKIIWKTELKGRAVVNALKELLEDEGYSQRAQRLGEMMRSKRFSPKERILEAVEYSGKFGRIPDLDVAGFSMGIMEYFNIDVIIGWMFVIFIVFYSIYCLISRLRGGKKLKFE